jgi:predicted MFS family arabinose efflux permease
MRPTGLWHNADFMKLWLSETISVFGSAVGGLAYSILAAVSLHASPTQMGILAAANSLPWLLIGLFAGVWVDRFRRRPVLMIANLGRALLVGAIPLLMITNLLTIEYLYVSNFFYGALTVFFDIAYQSYLPSLIKREDLTEGNSKMEVSRSASHIAGPGLGGIFIQYLGVSIAIVVDAVSFVVSAVLLNRIRNSETPPERPQQSRSIWQEIREGLSALFNNIYMRSSLGNIATFNLCYGIVSAVYVLFLTRDLQLQPVSIGIIYTASGPGALVGALIAGRLTQRLGLGPTLVGTAFLSGIVMLLIPLAGGPQMLAIALLIAGQFLLSLIVLVYSVNGISLRQAVTPDRLLGRMTASMRFLTWGVNPVGALLGGLSGEMIGLRGTLWVAALGAMTGFLWIWFSPVRQLREPPAMDAENLVPGSSPIG